MKRMMYLICSIIIACLVASMIGWSVAAGNFIIPIITIPLGVIVILACRAHVDEIIEDERISRIRSKAALRTLEVVIIGGAIIAVILYSYLVSIPLTPVIAGKFINHDEGTSSIIITEYEPGSQASPETVIRSTTIPDLNAMNESEAMAYCSYVRESYRKNEERGLIGLTLGYSIFAVLIAYGVFFLYYRQKY